MKRYLITLAAALVAATQLWAAGQAIASDLPYSPSTDPYAAERCKLDVYSPGQGANLPVVLWLHGGGLTGGNKEIPEQLRQQGVVVVAANYRLMPHVPIDSCIADAAAALAWTVRHAAQYGGSPRKVIVSGHSAGGYLGMMVALDKQWLAPLGLDPDSCIAALVPFSGQAITHFAHRDSQGIGNLQPTIDRYAPLFHVRKTAFPTVLITGDREVEIFGRYEENAYLYRMMLLNGNNGQVWLHEIPGTNHGTMVPAAFPTLLQWVRQLQ